MKRLGWALVVNVAFVLAVLATLFAFSPRRARGAEGNARWSRSDLPIQVLVAPEALDHHGAIARACLIINRAAGVYLFEHPRPASLVYVREFMASGHGLRGHVLVRADGEWDPPRMHVEPVFSRPGRLYSVVITIPRARIEEWRLRAALVHEFIHAAGAMGHANHPGSIGFRGIVPEQDIGGRERRFLREYRP